MALASLGFTGGPQITFRINPTSIDWGFDIHTSVTPTVGGRVGSSMEIGFVTGSGSLRQEAGLDLRLVDDASVPARDDTVVTWGSSTGPYAPGVPIGTITEVYSSLREASQRAVVKPFVDFSALDVVGVMVPSGSDSDRALIEADGTLK